MQTSATQNGPALKNNWPSFIHLDNPHFLDKKLKPISLFDVKTKTSIDNVYIDMDWEIIELN